MGLVDKFKNLFTEEIEEEVKPIKKEVRHVEIPSPTPKRETRAEEIKEVVSDSTTVNKEEKFVFPVYFDDKDFDDLEKPKPKSEPMPKLIKKDPPKQEAYQGPKVQKIERKFESSPIISPVYGILDKNYKKEDIATRKELPNDRTRKSKPMTIDDIRNKAFGTLEDDLEDTLFGNDSILFRDEIEDSTPKEIEDTGIDIFEELHFDEESKMPDPLKDTIEIAPVDDMDEDTILLAKQLEEQKKKLEQINDYINESVEENTTRNAVEEVKQEQSSEEDSINVEDLTESELLSLVDKMYEKRDGE